MSSEEEDIGSPCQGEIEGSEFEEEAVEARQRGEPGDHRRR